MVFDPEKDLEVPPVQDPEVRRFLEALTLKKPFGGKLFTYTRKLLEIVAKDVELHAYHGLPDYGLETNKVRALCSALPVQGIGLMHLVEKGVREFASPRFEAAQLRFASPGRPAPKP